MKLVIIGATGHVGSRVMTQALATGHAVTTITPHPETVRRRKRLKVVRGSTSDPGAVAHAARGADVVVVSLTGKTRDGTLMQARLPSIIRGLKRAGSPRLVLVSAFGAGDTIDKAPWYMRLVYRYVLGTIGCGTSSGGRVKRNKLIYRQLGCNSLVKQGLQPNFVKEQMHICTHFPCTFEAICLPFLSPLTVNVFTRCLPIEIEKIDYGTIQGSSQKTEKRWLLASLYPCLC